MSQYLSFYLKRKNAEITLQLGYFCTTPARQISGLDAFPYTEVDTLLAPQSVKEYLSKITEERDKFRKYLEDCVKKREEIEQSLYKCVSKEVAQMFLEESASLEQSIQELKESVEDWNWILDRISFMFEVWEENKNDWNFYYSNC